MADRRFADDVTTFVAEIIEVDPADLRHCAGHHAVEPFGRFRARDLDPGKAAYLHDADALAHRPAFLPHHVEPCRVAEAWHVPEVRIFGAEIEGALPAGDDAKLSPYPL